MASPNPTPTAPTPSPPGPEGPGPAPGCGLSGLIAVGLGIIALLTLWFYQGRTTRPESTPLQSDRPGAVASQATGAGASGQASAQAPTLDVSGRWEFIVDVTAASGSCAGEENNIPKPKIITITQRGKALIVLGFGTEDSSQWQGTITGDGVAFGGKRDEDGGVTTTEFTLTVNGSAMRGKESWSWLGSGGSCPNGRSDVTARRIGN
jgi:hypothetical protein